MDYKEIDRKRIMDYIASKGGECPVADIIAESGAEPLRVYALIFEESQAGHLTYLKESRLGAPEVVKLA